VNSLRITMVEIDVYEGEFLNMELDHLLRSRYTPGAKSKYQGYILKVFTNDGVVGYCQNVMGILQASRAVVDELQLVAEALLIGTNPLERERIWRDIWYRQRNSGGDPRAQGPVDIALWDIAGKVAGLPVYRLLGGDRTRVRAYASTGRSDSQPDGLSSSQAYANFVAQLRKSGFTATKLHAFGVPDLDIAVCRAVREAVGSNMDLMLDPAAEYQNYRDAVRVGRALDELDFRWYEDPLIDYGYNFAAHRRLAAELRVPLCVGDFLAGGAYLRATYLASGVADMIRADAYWRGGITGVLKIAHLCEAFGVPLELHLGGPAHLQLMGAIPGIEFCELGLLHPRDLQAVQGSLDLSTGRGGRTWIDDKGYVAIPEQPGVNTEVDWDYVRSHLLKTYRIGGRS
jgi:L-alanine-DL-glutamate epimerase-like enolase superfamily enzyme